MNKPNVLFPELDTRICGRCCSDERSTDLAPACCNGKPHRFVSRTMWVNVTVETYFDIRSPRAALRCFMDGTPTSPENYPLTRQLTVDEIALIRSGVARVVLRVEDLRSANAQPARRVSGKPRRAVT